MTDSTAPSPVGARSGWASNSAFYGLAVGLPVAALVFELLTHGCFEVLFDPIPTPWHVLLVAFVPMANVYARRVLATGRREHFAPALWLSTVAIGIAGFYTLLFLTLMPFSLLGILYMGFGLLPFAPFCALMGAIGCTRRLRRETGPARTWPGVALGLAVLLLLELPGAIALVGFEGERIDGLRRFGSRNAMLRATHFGRADVNLTAHWFYGEGWLRTRRTRGAELDALRATFYRVTGERALDQAPPRLMGRAEPNLFGTRRGRWDPDLGGERVGAPVEGLRLEVSRQDGRVDADAAFAYLEWTLVFRNDSHRQREARALLALPPGGVVTRSTLEVEGEEREAAVGSRRKVRQAYERVVRRRRDPLLVTATGRDRVLVQCFPVPPKGGEMRIRLGITLPLLLESAERGIVQLPRIEERNFAWAESLEHAVWIDSKTALERGKSGLAFEHDDGGVHTARGALPESEVSHWLVAARSGGARELWVADAVSPNGKWIHQRIEPVRAAPLDRVAVVVDGSRGMAPHAAAIADTLAAIPSDRAIDLIVASDEVVVLHEGDQPGGRSAALDALRSFRFEGGQDNVPALVAAWERASRSRSSAILWIHDPQPVLFEPVEGLLQRYERRRGGPSLVSVATSPGPDRVLEALPAWVPVEVAPRLGAADDDLRREVAAWTDGAPRWTAVRERTHPTTPQVATSPPSTASVHLSRLWANDEVRRILRAHRRGAEGEAAAVAAQYRLVTAVSGAVVLETDAQYAASDLATPPAHGAVDPGLLPVPEPSTGGLMAFGLLILAGVRARHRAAASTLR